MAEAGAQEAYGAARLAYELGRTVRQLREQRDWSQTALADSARHDPVRGGPVRGGRHGTQSAGTRPSGPSFGRRPRQATWARGVRCTMLPCGRVAAPTPVHQPCLHVSAMSVADESRSPAT